MGGVNIYCGTFQGRDKSGTPFEYVLADITAEGNSDAHDVVKRINDALETASDHVLVQPDDASALIKYLAVQLDRYEADQ